MFQHKQWSSKFQSNFFISELWIIFTCYYICRLQCLLEVL
ncbi:unnamed protein product [Brugia timori]|uniref:Uncharacterized protein n=1 Tax=Brugia timori TaxID=42155 RepID=A0A0R3QX41_9BILA|nr:unnamed protein product [Brugia timori]